MLDYVGIIGTVSKPKLLQPSNLVKSYNYNLEMIQINTQKEYFSSGMDSLTTVKPEANN